MSVISRLRVIVSGRVQGVGYRYFAQSEASGLGLVGYVCNLPNGDVELEAEGSADRLDQLILALRRGPSLSRVIEMKVSDRPPREDATERFRITY